MVYSVLLQTVNISEVCEKVCINNKVCNLHKKHHSNNVFTTENVLKNIINNNSSFDLTDEGIQAVSYGLD